MTFSKSGEPKEVDGLVDQIIKSIVNKFNLAMVQPQLVKQDCDKLRKFYQEAGPDAEQINLDPLFPLLHERSGEVAEIVFSLLADIAIDQSNPLPIVEALLIARDKSIALKALDVAIKLADNGSLKISRSFIKFLAGRAVPDNSSFSNKQAFEKISILVKKYVPGPNFQHTNPLMALYLEEENMELRKLSALILDNSEKAITHEVMDAIFGKKQAAFFLPYLIYTKATYLDLLCFYAEGLDSLADDFIQVREVLGEKLLCQVISKIGWGKLNLGIEAKALSGISIGNSPSFMVSEFEASMLDFCEHSERTSNLYAITACGGQISDDLSGKSKNDPINRFRSYNLNHASLLSDFLDVGPLSVDKVWDVIRRMDMIVEDYIALFKHLSDECAILPEVYQKIRDKITKKLDDYAKKPQFSADLTRLIQSFEEPDSVGSVRTLHGLKRYLHQQGLSMGFKLAVGGRSPNRTVDIVIANDEGVQSVYNNLRFADFEPGKQAKSSVQRIPYTVKLLIEGFTRQLVHGQEQFPKVDIFCYGNEVHYYFGYRNHPAFLRIDYAPPLRGGMIDLEYFGVSSYNLDQHPNISLDSIRAFFQRIEFAIQINGMRIHARYDKERALTLGDLCEKAKQVFQMAAYFMDLDWIIGSLALDRKAKQKVTNAWLDFYLHWGFLPEKAVLTKDKIGILKGYDKSPTGELEKNWSGEGKYVDKYSGCPPAGSYSNIISIFRKHGLEIIAPSAQEDKIHPGQLDIEKRVLNPLHESLARGELVLTDSGFRTQSSSLFKRVHEAEIFAELLDSGLEELATSIRTARLVRPMERIIKFNTTGCINGYLVQKSVLVLRGEEITFYVLRGAKEMIRLAFFTRDQVVYKRRLGKSKPWVSNANRDDRDLADLLKANDFIDTLPKFDNERDKLKAGKFLEEIQQSVLPPGKAPLRGDRIVTGLKASPGKTIGKVLFGTEGRNPLDFRGSILVASSIRPEDTTYLYYTNGIISTGGGILSHAGLIAMQFHKPALIISGIWQKDSSGRQILVFKSLEYQVIQKNIKGFVISIRTDIQEKQYTLREGDLVILDALTGNMRLLGKESIILALYEGFRLYSTAKQRLSSVKNEREILNLRGKLLRARHQIENGLRRCGDPVLARYAVFEILLNEPVAGSEMSFRDKYFLLSVLLNNLNCTNDAREYLLQIMVSLNSRFADSIHKAQNDMPSSEYVFEILYLRLDIMHQMYAVESAAKALLACDIKLERKENFDKVSVELLAIKRLIFLKTKLFSRIRYIKDKEQEDFRLRHLLRQVDRLKDILPISKRSSFMITKAKKQLEFHDAKKLKTFANNLIIESPDCGFELYNYIGWKAANLAEIERLSNEELVPPWFVVTDLAFRKMMQTKIKEMDTEIDNKEIAELSLQEAIAGILDREDLSNQQKSIQIRSLWERMQLPDVLSEIVKRAYRKIVGKPKAANETNLKGERVYVAVRSSSLEEDTEAAAHAGEFETYLYIHGDDQLLYYLKQTWSGLWTERAIHNRALLGDKANLKGGGVIVQRMVNSRVSGVLQTVNIPKGNIREMVINAGLGLGEGVVSGTVAADQVTVTKGIDPEKELLRFSYITSDKTMQIVFNHHAGFGTVATQTIYHQRLRPAMEYVELCQLVRNAAVLEKAYGYPLDIEFGIEEDHLWILQARPVASFATALNETIERFPINGSIKQLT